MPPITESALEETALAWLETLGWRVRYGPDIEPDAPAAERDEFTQVILARRLRDALARLNPTLPADALEDAFRKITRPASPSLVANNRAFHHWLANGVEIEYRRDGRIVGNLARVVDFENPDNNDWLAVNQFTVVEKTSEVSKTSEVWRTRRPDIVLFVNGLPLVVIELKNPADENATIWSAFNQLQTYKQQIPSLFVFNEALVISDGLTARIGTLTADRERCMPWRTMEGETIAPATMLQLKVLLKGVFDKRRWLDFLHYFIVFEDDGSTLVKKMAGYHQFHAVNAAVEETIRAAGVGARAAKEEHGGYFARPQLHGEPGDRRAGVIPWHLRSRQGKCGTRKDRAKV